MKKEIIFGIAKFRDGKTKESRNFVDTEAFSRWANKQFLKDEQVTVFEYRDFKQYSIWHA